MEIMGSGKLLGISGYSKNFLHENYRRRKSFVSIFFLTIFGKTEISQKLRSPILVSDFGFNSKNGLCEAPLHTRIRPIY